MLLIFNRNKMRSTYPLQHESMLTDVQCPKNVKRALFRLMNFSLGIYILKEISLGNIFGAYQNICYSRYF